MSFTAHLISLILQQYKIGFKVELKNIKVIVVFNGVTSTDEGLFSVFRYANNQTALLTAATERWTLSLCIVLYLLEVVDSLLLKDLRRDCVGDAT